MKGVFQNIMTVIRDFKIDEILSVETLVRNLGYFVFLGFLLLVYIWNTHYAERTIRQIDNMKSKLREERWEYMTAKNELMFNTKQTELAEKVKNIGLRELNEPPKKIVIEEDEY